MKRNRGNWPADMLTEILLKLPVKSIIRFKCVAKTWCHLFQNPTFISQHLSISKNNKRLLVYFRDENNNNGVMRLFVDEALVSYHDFPRQCLPSHFASMPIYMPIFDVCMDNGLFCLLHPLNSSVALWNPATKESKILPECNPPEMDAFREVLGFGLDPLSNDYKVIYIRYSWDLERQRQGVTHYAIYSTRSDSWTVFKAEEIEFFKDQEFYGNFINACVNGVYYWLTFKADEDFVYYEYKVLALNLGTEVFQLIDTPFSECHGQLFPFHYRIAICDNHFIPDVKIINEIWVLNDEEDGHNWTKVLKIELAALELQRMFGFWKNGNLLVESVSGHLMLYDVEKEEAKELGIQTGEVGDFLYVFTYDESLVAIGK